MLPAIYSLVPELSRLREDISPVRLRLAPIYVCIAPVAASTFDKVNPVSDELELSNVFTKYAVVSALSTSSLAHITAAYSLE